MNIIPVKTEYNFEVLKHTAKATLEHIAGVRKTEFYFDDKLVGSKTVAEGQLLSDDDCIADIVSEYTRNNTGVYADIFGRHTDKVYLVNKKVTAKVDAGAFVVDIFVKCEKGSYQISLSTNGGKDKIVCQMAAADFSEAFEKSRILLYGMEDMNSELSKHFNELSNDQIMEIIKWKE